MKENNVVDPYIIVVGTPEHCEAAHLVVDCNIVSEVDISDIPVTLMAAFFVFNICYPIGCCNFYSIMEIMIMNYPIAKSSSSVKHLYSSLIAL